MSAFDRRLYSHFNWTLLALVLIIFAFGIINLYSASSLRLEQGVTTVVYYKKQILWGVFGIIAMSICIVFDYRHLKNLTIPLYVITIILLIWVYFFGIEIGGSRRWIDFGIIHFQPTELAKITILFIIAHYLSRIQTDLDFRDLCKALVLVILPCSLIILQPDLGSGLNILLIVAGIIIYNGLNKRVFWSLMLSIPVVAPCIWFLMQDYQKTRILTFLNPHKAPLDAGYNQIQSQIAIGSGELWGKGYLSGTQSQLKFLPAKHTDFVFAVLGEEWGFIGCIILLALYCLFLYQIVLIVRDSKDVFGSVLAAGIFFYFFWQILINMSMVLGLMPIVGLPLPFFSYGGTFALLNFSLVGILLNISMRRYVFKQA